jgi:alpha-ketoglutarate-dependent taurine dioxygenase
MAYEMQAITPAFGRIVTGIDLKHAVTKEIKNQIMADLHTHRLLLFKNQGKIPAERQVEISQWFGQICSTFYKHPASPHPHIFRVSNDESEGCRNVGRSGWHIDGSFQDKPFKVQTMHFWAVSKAGATLFSPLREVIANLDDETRKMWDRLWFASDHGQVHPLIYPHPVTNEPTMCFHCGEPFVNAFAVDYDSAAGTASRLYDWPQTQQQLRDITAQLEANAFRCEWELGDFALIDNLACGHYAHPDTQLDPAVDGLRILHRTTVQGDSRPQKPDASKCARTGETMFESA